MKKLLTLFLAMIASVAMMAQVTTASMSGKVSDEAGPLPGATVIAIHVPSGTPYGTTTNSEGRYSLQGMRVGGPYTVEVRYVGYTTSMFENIVLKLGENHRTDFILQSEAIGLGEVVISSEAIKPASTANSTTISSEEITNLPTINRSITDVVKVSPYANGMSFAGSDGRSTNFTVDGANFNNNFGLSSNLPGGGTPISIDALEEVQVVVAPFDVRQSNFVGGGINAITKSGTNQFHGSAYTYYNNQTMRGNRLMGEDLGVRPEESMFTYGATVGGPIVKNKLFFFLNAERTNEPSEVIQYRPDEASAAILDQIYDKLVNDYGYNPGSYTNYPGGNNNLKLLARIDWNINDNNKLMFRFNKTGNTIWNKPNNTSCDDNFRPSIYRSSEYSFPFSNNMYSQRNDVMSFAAELNSRFSSQLSNQFLFTYTDINDQRGSNSSLFPHIDIMSGYEDLQETGKFIPFTSFGYELFSYNNGVKNKVFNAVDNVTYYTGSHKITAGLNWERQTASNSYMRNGTGYYRFASVDDFLTGAMPLSFALTVGNNGEANPRGEITYNQFGLYAQDDWNITDNFKLNFGVRADGIFYDNSQLMTNNAILAYDMGGNTINTGKWPKTRIQVSPRVGFTWNAAEDLTVRGGTGLFQGRLPLVFFTNMPQQAGMIQTLFCKNGFSGTVGTDPVTGDKIVNYTPETLAHLQALMKPNGTYITDVNEMINALNLNTTVTPEDGQLPGEINGVDPNFRMPQIWKSMLGIDYNVPVSFPLTLTLEGMFNKTIYGVRLVNWNLKYDMIANAGAEARFNGPDDRVNYRQLVDEAGNPNYYYVDENNTPHNAYVLTNTTEGYGYVLNAAIHTTPVKNLDIHAAYTLTESKEISGMPGSAASSAYSQLYSVNGPTFATLNRSQYVIPEKVTASISYMLPSLFEGDGVRISLFYNAYSAGAYSYTYSNDLNGDGLTTDLMYIPNNVDELKWSSEADKEAFKVFMDNDPYLSTHKGGYAEAYAGRSPWVHYLDARIAKTFKKTIGKTTHCFEISANIDNLLNMFNSSWGLYKYGCYGTGDAISPLKVDRFEDNTPVFSMNKLKNGEYPTNTFTNTYINTNQCWSVMLGLKYRF